MERRTKNKYGLTKKAEDFCRWFVRTGKGWLSYREAYHSKASVTSCTVSASRLLALTNIQLRIADLQKLEFERFSVTVERIGLELARIGFSDARDALDENGELLPLHKMPASMVAAIQSFDIYEEFDPKTNAFKGRLSKIKLAPKHPALETMAKWKRMIVERLEVSKVGDYASMSKEQLEALIAENEATLEAWSKARVIGSGSTEKANATQTAAKLIGQSTKKP